MKEHRLKPILNSNTHSQSSNYSNLSTNNQMEDNKSLNRDINNPNYLDYLGGFAKGYTE
jgi:hypothetical protein